MTRILNRACMMLVVLAGTWPALSQAAIPTIDLELVTEKNFPLGGQQKWYQLFADLKVTNLRIRSANQGDKTDIEEHGSKEHPTYRVVGILTDRNTVQLPGGQFSLTDKAGITKWLNELDANGIVGITEQKAAFGLTSQQLHDAHADLSTLVNFSTKGLSPGQAMSKLRALVQHKLVVDPALGRVFGVDETVHEELQGLTCGTVMAILLRPAGAVMQPRKPSGADVEYYITSAKQGVDAWPIGWPPEQEARQILPAMYEFLNVEFQDVPLSEALDAIQGRLQIPVVFDQNAIARFKIDLSKPVSLPSKRTYYSKILQDILFKAGLKSELRVDEAGKPLLWITSLKPLRD